MGSKNPCASLLSRACAIEGNARFLDAALRELGVMDAQGAWSYGQGRLMIAGDAVDRGRDVLAVLWRLYALGLDAASQGGAVHLMLGNHEQYLLLGNTSRAFSAQDWRTLGRLVQSQVALSRLPFPY